MIYDNLIIGSGISGLYLTYNLINNFPNQNFLILEKNDYIGGRMGKVNFYNTPIVFGAGIGRFKKDILLKKLLKKLNIDFDKFEIKKDYVKNFYKINILKIIDSLKKKYNFNKHRKLNFKDFFQLFYSKQFYKDFCKNTGYSDFNYTDAFEVLYYYGIDDTVEGWIGMSIDWNKLIYNLVKIIHKKNIKLNTYVKKIEKLKNNNFKIITNNNIFISKKIFIATDISSLKKLLPNYKIYNTIIGQNFIRLYTKFDKNSSLLMKKYIKNTTIVNTQLYKIIPINPDNGIYMIGYSDNIGARYLLNLINTDDKNFNKLINLIKKSLSIPKNDNLNILDIKYFYWNNGVHYYKPLPDKFNSRKEFLINIQNPDDNIFVIGEAVSRNQGWSEGALESVDNIIKKIK
jgi:hypothetical protein